MKDNYFKVRVSTKNKKELQKIAKRAGFDTLSSYVVFCIASMNQPKC